ncbi:universal stress protein [Brockia lithotrophica]|uniref:Nucleotide-binding universal stress UspA family protein n=1 Tax=Brockia lithotrophica TaxID=933949 RepID=A0A660LAX8_9BACL|nr:universal stress protein [Brockia lithotrophica]RKQ89113.1 nucleotide-binding universal stress UspA family protein [Brockia lithotrophica]
MHDPKDRPLSRRPEGPSGSDEEALLSSATPPRTLLVALDGSPPSLAAAGYALALGVVLGSRLHAVYVDPDGEGDPEPLPEDEGRLHEIPLEGHAVQGIRGLYLLARAAAQKGTQVRLWVARGNIVDGILRTATHVDANAIFMGNTGRSGLGRLLLGSVAEEVLRRSHLPVTVVRGTSGIS